MSAPKLPPVGEDRSQALVPLAFCLAVTIGCMVGFAVAEFASPASKVGVGSVLSSAVGPFLGAGLAFLATKLHDHSKLRRANLAAARRAISLISEHINDVLQYRAAVYGRVGKMAQVLPADAPRWAYAFPVDGPFVNDARFDMDSLAFLFESDTAVDLYQLLFNAQRKHAHLVFVSRALYASAREMQERFAKSSDVKPEGATLAAMQKALGMDLAARLSDLMTDAVAACDEATEASFLAAAHRVKEETLRRYEGARSIPTLHVPETHSVAAYPPIPGVIARPGEGRF